MDLSIIETIPQSEDSRIKSLKMSLSLLALGMPKEILVPFLLEEGVQRDSIKYFLSPPIITSNDWLPPKWVYEAIYPERLIQITYEQIEGRKGQYCTAIDLVCAMYGASMVAPMHREYSELYLWACSKVFKRWKPEAVEQGNQLTQDIEFRRVKQTYREVASDIRRKATSLGHSSLQSLDHRPGKRKAKGFG